MLETNLKVLKTNFKVLKIDFRLLEPNFKVPKLEKAKIRSVLFVSQVIVDFEPSGAKTTKAKSTFQASSSREVKDGKLSLHLFILIIFA